MHRYAIIFAVVSMLVAMASCQGTRSEKVDSNSAIPIVDFNGLKPYLNKQTDTTYIVNFWATWCAPCVKELPHFEKIALDYANKKVKVILVNLDFPSYFETRLIPFIEENQIQSTVIMLDDPNANFWINEVNPKWTGSIPATLIYNKNKRGFFEKEFSYSELEDALKHFI